jgi:hypothetical protein
MKENVDDWCEQEDFVERVQDKDNKGPSAQDPNQKIGEVL